MHLHDMMLTIKHTRRTETSAAKLELPELQVMVSRSSREEFLVHMVDHGQLLSLDSCITNLFCDTL